MDIDDDNDSDNGDASDDDLFFKRLEQKIHNEDNGKISLSTMRNMHFKIGTSCQEIAG